MRSAAQITVLAGLFIALVAAADITGVNVDYSATPESLTCIKNTTQANYITTYLYINGTFSDVTALTAFVTAAQAANFARIDFVIAPAPGQGSDTDGKAAAAKILQFLNDNKLIQIASNIWVSILPFGFWDPKTQATNWAYLNDLTNAFKEASRSVTIFTTRETWYQSFGLLWNADFGTKTSVGYWHLDKNAGYDDWKMVNYGGWATPSYKDYKTTNDCGLSGVDWIYSSQ